MPLADSIVEERRSNGVTRRAATLCVVVSISDLGAESHHSHRVSPKLVANRLAMVRQQSILDCKVLEDAIGIDVAKHTCDLSHARSFRYEGACPVWSRHRAVSLRSDAQDLPQLAG